MNYYPFHLGDYAVHTRHLSLLEDLAYRRMLDWYYLTEQALPNDAEKIARLINMHRHVTKVLAVLEDFFVQTEQGYVSARCDKEIALYRGKAERAKSANKARWGIADADTNGDAEQDADANTGEHAGVTTLTNKTARKNASAQRAVERSIVLEPQTYTQKRTHKHTQTESIAIVNLKSDLTSETNQIATMNQEPTTNNQEPLKNTLSSAAQTRTGSTYSDAFEQAWQDYPARPGANKRQAYKAWNARLKAGVTAAHLHAGVQRYHAYVQACQTEPRYIKQPATFFGPDEHFKADWSVQLPATSATAADSAKSAHSGFDHTNYRQGVSADGCF